MLQTLRGWNFQIFRNQLEEWLLNDLQTETGKNPWRLAASFAYVISAAWVFGPFSRPRRRKSFASFGTTAWMELRSGDGLFGTVFCGFLSFQHLKFAIHQKVRFLWRDFDSLCVLLG